jgi:hypothetical protein
MTEKHSLLDKKKLLLATAVAIVVVLMTSIAIVLPAEYGIDPLGTGELLGLKGISLQGDEDTPTSDVKPYPDDFMTLTLLPRKGVEYKYRMKDNAVMFYSWNSTQEVYFDFHGEPKGAALGYYESFEIGSSNSSDGVFYAPFEGTHGWYWENKGAMPLTIALKTQGDYEVIGNPKS